MGNSKIGAIWQRMRDQSGGWLITLSVSSIHSHASGGNIYAAYPQCRAVVDDFGTLVCVGAWL